MSPNFNVLFTWRCCYINVHASATLSKHSSNGRTNNKSKVKKLGEKSHLIPNFAIWVFHEFTFLKSSWMDSDVIGNSKKLVKHGRSSCESPQKGESVILSFLRCSRWFETIICFSWTCQSTRIFIHQLRDNLWLGFPNALFGKSFWLFDVFSNNMDYYHLIHWLKYWVGWNIVSLAS